MVHRSRPTNSDPNSNRWDDAEDRLGVDAKVLVSTRRDTDRRGSGRSPVRQSGEIDHEHGLKERRARARARARMRARARARMRARARARARVRARSIDESTAIVGPSYDRTRRARLAAKGSSHAHDQSMARMDDEDDDDDDGQGEAEGEGQVARCQDSSAVKVDDDQPSTHRPPTATGARDHLCRLNPYDLRHHLILITSDPVADPPPQAYPGKVNPLLPPPTCSPRPIHTIEFPRPSRRAKIPIDPDQVPLPPSPPPQFDFTPFDLVPPSSSFHLLDDSPCMPTPPRHSPLDLSEPLIDLTDPDTAPKTAHTEYPIPGKPTPSRVTLAGNKTPYSHFTPLSSPSITERPALSSLLSSPASGYIPARFRNVVNVASADPRPSTRDPSPGPAPVIDPELLEKIQSLDDHLSRIEDQPKQAQPPFNSVRAELSEIRHSPSHPTSPEKQPLEPAHVEQASDGQTYHPRATSTTQRSHSSAQGHLKSSSVQGHLKSSSVQGHLKSSSVQGHLKSSSVPPSPAGRNSEQTAARIPASTRRSHSRQPSGVSSRKSRSIVSGTVPLTEAALRQHSSIHRSHLGNEVGLARSPAAPAPGFSPRPTDLGSRLTRWSSGEPKDDELASLVESLAQREEQRAEELRKMLLTVNQRVAESNKEFGAMTDMIRERSQTRQRELAGLTGEEFGSRSRGSQSNVPIDTLGRTPEVCRSVQDSGLSPANEPVNYESQRLSQPPPMMRDITNSLREASVAASRQAELLMENIRAASRAPSVKASIKYAASQVEAQENGVDDKRPPSGRETVRTVSEAGVVKEEAVPHTPQQKSEAGNLQVPFAAASAKTRSVSGSSKPPGSAKSAANARAPSAVTSVRQPSVVITTRSRSVTASLRAPPLANQESGLGGEQAPANPASSKASSITGSSKRVAGFTRAPTAAPSLAGSGRQPLSNARSSRAPTVAGNSSGAAPAPSVATAPPPIAGSARTPSVRTTTEVRVDGPSPPPPSTPPDAEELPPPQDAEELPPPQDAQELPPPPPPQDAEELAPPQDVEELPPSQDVEQLPPPQDVEELPPPQDAEELAPPPDAVEEHKSERVISQRLESTHPPTNLAESIRAASEALADGIVASQKAPTVASVPVDQDPGNTEGANEAEPAAEEGAPTGEEPAEDLTEAVEQASQKLPTPMGSLAGEVVGDRSNPPGSAIAADDENTGGKAERIVFSNIVNPLGEWIRFGRAGFRFHIIDSHPDVYNASKPA